MSPFAKVNAWMSTWSVDLLQLAATAFGIGIIVCAFVIWKGDEENVPKFKKGLFWTIAGFIVCLLAAGIITWVKSGIK